MDYDKYDNPIGDKREIQRLLTVMASINIPGNFNYFNSTTSININSLTYSDNLQSERLTFIDKKKYDNIPRSDLFMLKSETQSISGNFSARFNFPLKLTMNLKSN